DLSVAEQLVGAPLDDLLREQQEEIARLGLLVEASGRLLATLDLDALLPRVLELAQRTLEADAYALWRRDPASDRWTLQASSGLSDEYIRAAGRAVGRGERAARILDRIRRDARERRAARRPDVRRLVHGRHGRRRRLDRAFDRRARRSGQGRSSKRARRASADRPGRAARRAERDPHGATGASVRDHGRAP